MTQKIEIFGNNLAHFGGFDGSFLTILVVKKVVFWTFSKLLCSCLGSVWALFLVLKDALLRVLSAPKIYKQTSKNYMIPITDALLWGPAAPYQTRAQRAQFACCDENGDEAFLLFFKFFLADRILFFFFVMTPKSEVFSDFIEIV